jgi:steroid delta-isomerase-like uncharacterized protein
MDATAARNEALVRADCEAAVNAPDPAAIGERVAEDFEDHAPGAGPGPAGPAAVARRAVELPAFPDLGVAIEDTLAEDDRVAVRATWRGSHLGAFRGVPASGRRIEFSAMEIWRVEAGKIRERWTSADIRRVIESAAG